MEDKRFILPAPAVAVKEVFITGYRDYTHPKGERLLFSIKNGEPLPKGVIIGKGARLLVEVDDNPNIEGDSND